MIDKRVPVQASCVFFPQINELIAVKCVCVTHKRESYFSKPLRHRKKSLDINTPAAEVIVWGIDRQIYLITDRRVTSAQV